VKIKELYEGEAGWLSQIAGGLAGKGADEVEAGYQSQEKEKEEKEKLSDEEQEALSKGMTVPELRKWKKDQAETREKNLARKQQTQQRRGGVR